MSINRKAVSVEDASETVKEANKARDDAKKDAKKRYDDKIDEINSMVGLSQKKEKLLKLKISMTMKSNQLIKTMIKL